MKISISFINSLLKENQTVEKITKTDSDFIHLDIMDGKFVENKNYSFREIVQIIGKTKKKIDAHLMVNNPEKYLEDYASLNIEYLTFHYEAVKDVNQLIKKIKTYGIKVGISIKPNTNIELIKPFLKDLDQILIMSVEPGEGGQQFIPEVIDKIRLLNDWRNQSKYNFIISVDGGINDENINILKENEVDMVVVGSFVCLYDDYQAQINKLR